MAKFSVKWNSEKLLSLSAMGISLITLLIFIYQTNLMRKQNYLSIMPYLQLSTTDNKEKHTFELNLENHGVGPAIIESVTLYYKGEEHSLKEYNDYLYNFIRSAVPGLDSVKNFSTSTLNRGIAIPPNSRYNILGINSSPEDYRLITNGLKELMDNGLDYEIIYKSIQDERWRIHNDSEGPERLD